MTATKILTLPLSGRYYVDTVDDTYEVDTDAQYAVCMNFRRDGLGECVAPDVIEFDDIDCAVGCYLTLDGVPDGIVLGITAVTS